MNQPTLFQIMKAGVEHFSIRKKRNCKVNLNTLSISITKNKTQIYINQIIKLTRSRLIFFPYRPLEQVHFALSGAANDYPNYHDDCQNDQELEVETPNDQETFTAPNKYNTRSANARPSTNQAENKMTYGP